MSGFDNILNDLKAVTDEVGKKANETFEISKLSLERAKIKSRVQQNYQRLGEIVYGGHKNDEDVSDIVAVLYEQLDDDFARIEEIYNEICAVKAGGTAPPRNGSRSRRSRGTRGSRRTRRSSRSGGERRKNRRKKKRPQSRRKGKH